MHVSCEAPKTKARGKTATDRTAVIDAMSTKSWPYNELKTLIMTTTGKSEPTAKRIVSELASIGKIIKGSDNTYAVKQYDKIGWIHV